LNLDLNALLLVQVVIDGYLNRKFLSPDGRIRQINSEEERLEDPELVFSYSQAFALRATALSIQVVMVSGTYIE
jgi:hypothetical protein